MLSFRKSVDLGFVALHVHVMYQNILEWLTVAYLIAYKVLPTVSHVYFHQKSVTLAYIPEDIVMHSPYAKITLVNAVLFHDVYFVFFDY